MFIENMVVERFRHLHNVQIGRFREPRAIGELIVLAGPNGGGKSSLLELMSFGLASRYSWSYYNARRMSEHAYALKVGLDPDELSELPTDQGLEDAVAYLREHRGYWTQVNMEEVVPNKELALNERAHGLVSRHFANFERKLGFFIRSDRSYTQRNYDQRHLFGWRSKLTLDHLRNISYRSTTDQYNDMYDFLVEQSYHYIYALGTHSRRQKLGHASEEPLDPLAPYNELLGSLFPDYSFTQNEDEALALNVQLPNGTVVPFHEMSSGEREVFFILAFFIRKNISNSVIVIDEPELHLHPELARRFLQVMRTIRPNNQLWLATHSAELIDEAGRDRTFFVRRSEEDANRSICLKASSEEDEIALLRDMFGYSGYVGISKKIVFVEGVDSGADRKTFTKLFPELSREIRVIPVGGVETLYRLNRAVLALLRSGFARCEFYLVRDRDYLSEEHVRKHRELAPGRLFILERHHIENYLLDEEAISYVLRTMYDRDESPAAVRQELLAIAREKSAAFLRDMVVARFGELFQSEDCSVGDHSSGMSILLADGDEDSAVLGNLRAAIQDRTKGVRTEINERLADDTLGAVFDSCKRAVQEALDPARESWKATFPGKRLLQQYSKIKQLGEWPALQNLLIERLSEDRATIPAELQEIFQKIAGSQA